MKRIYFFVLATPMALLLLGAGLPNGRRPDGHPDRTGRNHETLRRFLRSVQT